MHVYINPNKYAMVCTVSRETLIQLIYISLSLFVLLVNNSISGCTVEIIIFISSAIVLYATYLVFQYFRISDRDSVEEIYTKLFFWSNIQIPHKNLNIQKLYNASMDNMEISYKSKF